MEAKPLTRRDYQVEGHEYLVTELLAGRSVLGVSPTGSGKSLVLIDVLQDLRLKKPDGSGPILTVPNEEIALGIWDKLDHNEPWGGGSNPREYIRRLSAEKRAKALQAVGVWNVKVFHNRLLSGDVAPPPYLLHDEVHHSVDDTHDVIHAVCGHCPRAGVTATAYRGTPDETAKLRKAWGEPWVILSLRKAVERGVIARPNFTVWPLVNDDLITIRDGEFVLSQVEGAVRDQLPELVRRFREELCDDNQMPLRPTIVRCPGVSSTEAVGQALSAAGITAVVVTGEATVHHRGYTPRSEVPQQAAGRGGPALTVWTRDRAFTACVAREAVLVQVRVVGEGVDLPVRVLVDLAPTTSPVLWQQAVGRITRPTPPGEEPPLYIATNHNLSRHAYLWEGLIPAAMIREAQTVWGSDWKPQRRHMARALGLEGFGRFTVSPLPLADGSYASLYALQTKDGMHLYAALLHPSLPGPFFFEKTNTATGRMLDHELPDGRTVQYREKKYGPWKRIDTIPSAEGYVSVKAGPVTDSMLDWWKKDAKARGLDPEAVPDWRQFQALPMFVNTRTRLVME